MHAFARTRSELAVLTTQENFGHCEFITDTWQKSIWRTAGIKPVWRTPEMLESWFKNHNAAVHECAHNSSPLKQETITTFVEYFWN